MPSTAVPAEGTGGYRRDQPAALPAEHPQPYPGEKRAAVKLTQVEYSIIKLFMDNPEKPSPREEILDSVWGRDYFGELKIVDVNIRRLRIKIRKTDPTNPAYITTVWGYGYKWGF